MDHRISASLPEDDRPDPSFGPVRARGPARPLRDGRPQRDAQPAAATRPEPAILRRVAPPPTGFELRAGERGEVASVFTTQSEAAEGRGLLRNAGIGLLVLLAGIGAFSLIHVLGGLHLRF